jgi:putative Mg2+ transporter-C (MgtC) family protein
MGAAMTTLTSQYLCLCMGYYTDMARMGAQVVAGIGFIGAGTIIVTRHQRVKGLTTAAGLWACAIVGLTIGAGFAEGGLLVTILMLAAELLFVRIEYRLLESSHESIYFLEYTGNGALDRVLSLLQEQEVRVLNMEITRSEETAPFHANAIVTVRLNKKINDHQLLFMLSCVDGILSAEEI